MRSRNANRLAWSLCALSLILTALSLLLLSLNLSVVGETVQPAHADLWLRSTAEVDRRTESPA